METVNSMEAVNPDEATPVSLSGVKETLVRTASAHST